jgi:hypothetical protein
MWMWMRIGYAGTQEKSCSKEENCKKEKITIKPPLTGGFGLIETIEMAPLLRRGEAELWLTRLEQNKTP